METTASAVNKEDIIQADLIGCVKWFNTKLGYGFITNLDTIDDDVFVHHSSIMSDSETFRYLIQGEYVQFTLSKTTSGPHATHAIQVTGVRKGKLLCDAHKYNSTHTSNINQYAHSSRGYASSSEDPGSAVYEGYKQLRQPRSVRYRPDQSPPSGGAPAYEKPYRVPRSASQK